MRNLFFIIIAGISIFFLLVILPTLMLAWGWNFFISPVFDRPQIDFWTALAGWVFFAFLRVAFLPFTRTKQQVTSYQPTTEQKEAMKVATDALRRMVAENAAKSERAAGRRDN